MDRHEWSEGSREFLLEGDGALYEIESRGDSPQAGVVPGFVAREILRLASFKETLEQVALAAGCLPTQFADAYGHVLEAVAAHRAERDRLAEEVERLKANTSPTSTLAMGRAILEERARIRRELLAEVADWTRWDARAFRLALDRIAPEED